MLAVTLMLLVAVLDAKANPAASRPNTASAANFVVLFLKALLLPANESKAPGPFAIRGYRQFPHQL
jgi:hypothetical protein